MDLRRLQAWWAYRQGLLEPATGSSAGALLARTGWARSVGGANPYLTLRARGSLGREAIDEEAASVAISELPAARGCTYVVPAADFDLALALARATGIGEVATAMKLGVPAGEIEALAESVLEALADGAKDPAELKAQLGSQVRNLGEEGKKKGLTTTLPVALGLLQQDGLILRRPVSGRFDTQKYSYVKWDRSGVRMPAEEAYLELARRYFHWIGSATPAHFSWFSGLGVRAAKAVLDQLPLVPLEAGSPYLLPSEMEAEFRAFEAPKEPVYAMVSSLDGLFLLRREVAPLVAQEHLNLRMPSGKGFSEVGGVQDLSSNAIVDRGRIVGLWEYDPGTKEIVHAAFEPLAPQAFTELEKLRDWAEQEMGDIRSFSLDSPASRKPYLDGLRAGLRPA